MAQSFNTVIIIGAGVSGIAAATKLLKNNFKNFIVLEAENRIGGRIQTLAFGGNYCLFNSVLKVIKWFY